MVVILFETLSVRTGAESGEETRGVDFARRKTLYC
jgi:hypothetical protein